MLPLEKLRRTAAAMTAPALTRHLLLERFPKGCATTSSLRARSIVVLGMIAEIDRSAPVIFCHAPAVYPESIEYRSQIVRLLGLTDIRDPEKDEAGILPDDQDHYEEIRSGVWGGGTVGTTVHLNRSLAGFPCWISAAYHRPYADDPTGRLVEEGRILRVDPLNGWSQEDVYSYMARHGLPHHPRIVAPTYHY